MSKVSFLNVTELAGDEVSKAQLSRFYQRYVWASGYCAQKDVLEAACGTGPGLGYLLSKCKTLTAGDFAPEVLSVAKSHYGNRVNLVQFDAQSTPFANSSFDLVILFEALYYLPDADKFFNECRRILRTNGRILLATANCSLFDFNPSPYSTKYFTVPELASILKSNGFSVECFGGSPISKTGLKTKIIRCIKKLAVSLNIIPGSMNGKKFLKRLFFGKLVIMPKELSAMDVDYIPPVQINSCEVDLVHQVIYFSATLETK